MSYDCHDPRVDFGPKIMQRSITLWVPPCSRDALLMVRMVNIGSARCGAHNPDPQDRSSRSAFLMGQEIRRSYPPRRASPMQRHCRLAGEAGRGGARKACAEPSPYTRGGAWHGSWLGVLLAQAGQHAVPPFIA